MTFPLYFLKSTLSDKYPEENDPSAQVKSQENEQKDQIPVSNPVVPEIKAEKPEKPDKQKSPDKSALFQLLQDAGVEVIDKRKNGGALWVIGGDELKPLMDQCKKIGVKFAYKPGGGKVSQNRDAWWTK